MAILQNPSLRWRKRGAEVRRIPKEREKFPLCTKENWIAFVEVSIREAARPCPWVVMKYNRAPRRISRVHMGTAREVAKTHVLQGALECRGQFRRRRGALAALDKRLR